MVPRLLIRAHTKGRDMIIYKPGTQKPLAPRTGNYSVRWGNLVLSRAGIENPSKEVKKKIVELWALGYSHKDAAKAIRLI